MIEIPEKIIEITCRILGEPLDYYEEKEKTTFLIDFMVMVAKLFIEGVHKDGLQEGFTDLNGNIVLTQDEFDIVKDFYIKCTKR